MTQNWHGIWCKRKPPQGSRLELRELLAADGFDLMGQVDETAWHHYLDEVAARLAIQPGDSLFDVGCGAGAFLHPFHAAGHPVGGLDYSPVLIHTAQRAMPAGRFEVGEAVSLTAMPRYDWVCSNGVFLYFRDADYARAVLLCMAEKARKGMAVLDVPDLATRERALQARRTAYTGGDYDQDYRGLEHLFLPRGWWRTQAEMLGLSVEIHDQCLAGYLHAPYRYNVFLHKQR